VIEQRAAKSASSLATRIREAAQFDVAIFFENNWTPSLAVWRAGIPLRVGRRSGAVSWFYNQHPAEPEQPLDSIRMNLHIAQSVGANINQALT
jgi:ADP-heptose:LPS heptosyltransferase